MKNILNIAHRGLTTNFPENTLEAFGDAIRAKIDGIEFDVQETVDQNFVVLHDSKLEGNEVGKLSLAQINAIKIKGEYRVPTLLETLDLCFRRIKMVIELKKVWSIDYFIAILKLAAELDDIIVASFDRDLILRLSHQPTQISKAVISVFPIITDPVKNIQSVNAEALILRFPFVTKELVNKMHASNLMVYGWGYPDVKSVLNAIEIGVDGAICDFADKVSEEIRNKV